MGYIIVPFTESAVAKSKLFQAFDKEKCICMMPERRGGRIRSRIARYFFARKIVKLCHSDDIVISWKWHIAHDVTIVSWFMKKPVKVLAMNFIDHTSRSGLRFKTRAIVYNKLFKDPNFFNTVNCLNYLDEYEKKYKICRERFFELRDSNLKLDFNTREFSYGNGSIFSGGKIRDWDTYIKAAQLLPQYNFILVRGDSFNYKGKIPSNVQIYQNINEKIFFELIKNCSISVTTLPSTVPNGFTVMIQSACLNRPIIATDCVPVKELLYDSERNLWGGVTYELKNPEDLAKKIDMLYKDLDLRRTLCANMSEIIKQRSVEETSKKLLAIADKILYE